MTALVSIMGGLPVALGIGTSGAEWRRSLGIAVLGGLTTSTFLTLFVIPVVYTLLEDLVGRFRRRRVREPQVPETPEAPVSVPQPQPVTGGSNGKQSQ
jgi:HAE1 family hydrophobic/amphiphilic exporter-1